MIRDHPQFAINFNKFFMPSPDRMLLYTVCEMDADFITWVHFNIRLNRKLFKSNDFLDNDGNSKLVFVIDSNVVFCLDCQRFYRLYEKIRFDLFSSNIQQL